LIAFYEQLNDVSSGGRTVFPDLDLSIRPQKGMAVLWFNKWLNGSVDFRALHGGCPVLGGEKWSNVIQTHLFTFFMNYYLYQYSI
jgi:hypothetical protein